uniref:Inner membrane protein n=1 Tax=Globodera pallida TaxID=36090 RepID=A0A183CDK3_GLOPA
MKQSPFTLSERTVTDERRGCHAEAKHFKCGNGYCVLAGICLLVVYGQQARNPWLFLPCLILGAVEVISRVYLCFVYLVCTTQKAKVSAEFGPEMAEIVQNYCMPRLIGFAVSIVLSVWLFSIIVRGFLAVKEAESRRYRPHF